MKAEQGRAAGRDGEPSAGAHGLVWTRWDDTLGQAVAHKRSHTGGLLPERAWIGRLSHPNLGGPLGWRGDKRGGHALLAAATGPSLAQAMVDTPQNAPALMADALRGLAYLHAQGLIHGDLHPDNLRLTSGGHLKLLDFGMTSEGEERGGVVAFMAPERRAGGPPTVATDLYALGLCFMVSLGGQPRSDGAATAGLGSTRLGPLTELLTAMTHPDPARRPGSAAMAATLLAHHAGDASLAEETLDTALAWLSPPKMIGREEALAAALAAMEQHPVVCLNAPRGVGATRFLLALEARGAGARSGTLAGQAPSGGALLLDRHDTGTKGAIAALDAALRGSGLRAVVVTVAGDPLHDHLIQGGAASIPLGPLSAPEVGALIGQVFAHRGDSSPLTRALTERFGGRPRQLTGALRSLWAQGAIKPGAFGAAEPLDLARAQAWLQTQGDMPLGRYIDRALPATGPARKLAALVTVARRPLDEPLLQAAWAHLDEPSPVSAAEITLRHRGILRPESAPAVDGASLKAALAAHLGESALSHARQALMAAHSTLDEEEGLDGRRAADALALRLDLGGDTDPRAAIPLIDALLDQGLIDDAVHLIERLSPHPAAARLRVRLALETGKPHEAQRLAEACADEDPTVLSEILCRTQGADAAVATLRASLATSANPHRLRLVLGRVLIRVGRATEGLEELEALAQAPLSAALKGELNHWLGRGHLNAGHYDAAQTHLEAARAWALEAGEHREEGAILQALTQIHDLRGEREAAVSLLERALTLAETAGDPLRALTRRSHLAAVRYNNGGSVRRSLAVFTVGSRQAMAWGHGVMAAGDAAAAADLLLFLGQLDEAEVWAKRAITAISPEHNPICVASALEVAGRVSLYSGRLDVAVERAQSAMTLAGKVGLRLRVIKGQWIVSEAQRLRGDGGPDTLDALEATHREAEKLQLPHEDLQCLMSLAQLALTAGRRSKALKWLLHAEALLLDDPTLRDAAWRVEALKALASGDDDARAFHAKRALEKFAAESALLDPPDRAPFARRSDRRALIDQVSGLAQPDRGEQRIKRLMDLGRQLRAGSNVNTLLTTLVDEAIDLCGAERGFVLLRRGAALAQGPEGPDVLLARAQGKTPLPLNPVRASRTVAESVWARGEAARIVDALEDPYLREQPSIKAQHLRSILCAPLINQGQCLGALYLDHRFMERAFDQGDLELLQLLADQAAIALVQSGALGAQPETHPAGSELRFGRLVGQSAAMLTLLKKMPAIAQSHFPVLISGESGTGKELLARAIASEGARAGGAFVAVNCGAIPEALIESELFGHTRGAFTGAEGERTGLVKEADGGVLFLDEVGEMPLNMQVKLLRALQEGEIRPVGASQAQPVDVRVVAATHRDLRRRVREGSFREDLYYRLAVLEVAIPPLRERPEDIPHLCQHILSEMSEPPSLTPAALDLLKAQPWPGNVRELKATLQRATVFSGKATLGPQDIKAHLSPTPPPEDPAHIISIHDAEAHAIRQALKATQGNKSAAARRLGIGRRTLYDKLERLGLEG